MNVNQSSDIYYFWTNSESNTWGITISDSEKDDFSTAKEITLETLSTITTAEDFGGNGEGPSWGDAVLSRDGERLFANARSADKVVVLDTETLTVESILDVGDRPVHSETYNDEIWVHVDGDGGFNVINQETLEVSELIEANTVGTGHGKLLVSKSLGADTYVTNTSEPAVFPINLESRIVGEPITIGGGDPEVGSHDRGYDPATGIAYFQLTGGAGFSFIDVDTNEVIADQVPISGRATHTPNDEYLLILDSSAESNDVGIWNPNLETHTLPRFDDQVTVGGSVSVNGTKFYNDGGIWEAWIPQTSGENIAVLNLATNEVEYIPVGTLTTPEGARHFSRLGAIDQEYFFTYSDEGAYRIDLDTHEVSPALDLPGIISRVAIAPEGGGQNDDRWVGDRSDDYFNGKEGNDTIRGQAGDDELKGGVGDDLILGNLGNDALTGQIGRDRLKGGQGEDTLQGGAGDDHLSGGQGKDLLKGGAQNDDLNGGSGHDFLLGQSGDDLLQGRGGNDVLDGGRGADRIRFRSTNEGIDTILNFETIDRIELSAKGFGFAVEERGILASSHFVIGSRASTSTHRVIYDDVTGALFFDSDGSGSGSQIQFAELSGVPTLSEDSFQII